MPAPRCGVLARWASAPKYLTFRAAPRAVLGSLLAFLVPMPQRGQLGDCMEGEAGFLSAPLKLQSLLLTLKLEIGTLVVMARYFGVQEGRGTLLTQLPLPTGLV